jgi:hypothetical protein
MTCDRWMDQTAQRQQARIARVHGAEGIIPLPVWFALYSISAVILVYMLFFADPGEAPSLKACSWGAHGDHHGADTPADVLRHPHGTGLGTLQPTAMQRSLRLIDAAMDVAGLQITSPCDQKGRPL